MLSALGGGKKKKKKFLLGLSLLLTNADFQRLPSVSVIPTRIPIITVIEIHICI